MAGFVHMFSNKYKTMLLLLVTLAALQTSFCSHVSPSFHKTCSVFYSKAQGKESITITGKQSLNIPEVHWTSQSCKRLSTGSLKIEPGCEMRMCNSSNLGGNCELLEPGRYSRSNLSEVFGGSIASISCACSKECKCSDIFMKRRSCARAYLEGGCRTCNSFYFELTGSEPYIEEEYVGKVKALRLRKGCKLTLYSEESYEGTEEHLNDDVIEDYKGGFISYVCECNDDEYVAKVKAPRSASSPSFVEIPSDEGAIIEMLKSYKNHPGLRAALKSYKSGRSSRNVYILLLGTMGSGKRSTVNLLFDSDIINRALSCDGIGICEYRIPVPVDEWGIANSELRIIDTPNFGDTRGIEYDAKTLANLDNFLSTHEDLKDRIPNVVLIFHKFHDNRFREEGSVFRKMLHGYDSLRDRITDENFTNVIFVFSHFCSEIKSITRNPKSKLNLFKDAIERYSHFPRPIIMTVAENQGKNIGIPMMNGHFKLPNGEFYPKNLIEKIKLVTTNGKDVIGHRLIRNALRDRDTDDFIVTYKEYHIANAKDSKVEKYFSSLNSSIPDLVEITQPMFLHNPVVGYGYSLYNDTSLPTSPFQQRNLLKSDIGFMIPNFLTVTPSRISKTNFLILDNQSEYIEHRLQSLGLEGVVTGENFNGTLKSGYNIKTDFLKHDGCTLSFTREMSLFQFSLDFTTFTPEFYEEVASLPVYRKDNQETVGNWTEFFKKYGTHVVSSGYGGGSVEIGISSDLPCDENFIDALSDLLHFVEDMPVLVTGESRNSQKYLLRNGYNYSLLFLGGDSLFYLSNCKELSFQQAAFLFGKWKESIKTNPVILPSSLKLLPISYVVEKLGSVFSAEVDKANSDIYKFSVNYVTPNNRKENNEAETDLEDEAMLTIGESLSNLRNAIENL